MLESIDRVHSGSLARGVIEDRREPSG